MEKKDRVILHSDLNNFFASVEIALNPELGGKPLIVCGDPKERRGVVLAKNEEAKKLGIKTAETVYSALKKCPDVQMVRAHHTEYVKFSKKVVEIYSRFTDQIEECSIDECALDMTESTFLFGSGFEIAEKIRKTVKEELGLTVSVGVSFNKVFAKLASELKKPDAVTEITRENYQKVVWNLPVKELLFVGHSTEETLHKLGIKTIGDLAHADEEMMNRFLGKRGRQLRVYARGEDEEPVKAVKEKTDLKSIGNSMTLPQNIFRFDDVKRWFHALAESVSARLKAADVGKANTVHIVVRNDKLQDTTCQMKVPPTTLCGDIAKAAYELYCKHFPESTLVRMLGITVSGFDYHIEQMSLDGLLDGTSGSYEKRERAESAIAKIREKYGYASMQRGVVMEDEKLNGLDIRGKKEETTTKLDGE